MVSSLLNILSRDLHNFTIQTVCFRKHYFLIINYNFTLCSVINYNFTSYLTVIILNHIFFYFIIWIHLHIDETTFYFFYLNLFLFFILILFSSFYCHCFNLKCYVFVILTFTCLEQGFQRKWILLARNCELCKLLAIPRKSPQLRAILEQLRAIPHSCNGIPIGNLIPITESFLTFIHPVYPCTEYEVSSRPQKWSKILNNFKIIFARVQKVCLPDSLIYALSHCKQSCKARLKMTKLYVFQILWHRTKKMTLIILKCKSKPEKSSKVLFTFNLSFLLIALKV